MTDFDYKRRNLMSGPHFLGVLLVAAGLFALASPMFLASSVLLHTDEATPVFSFTYSDQGKAMKNAEYLATHLPATLESC